MSWLMSCATLSVLERAVEMSTGESAAILRERTIDETRQLTEAKHGAPTSFVSHFPVIGRGNVLRDHLVSHEKVESDLDTILSTKK